MYGYGRDPYFDPYYGGMPPPMMPEPYPAPPVPPLPPMPPQMAAPPPMPAPPHPLVALESPSMDYYYPSGYSRSVTSVDPSVHRNIYFIKTYGSTKIQHIKQNIRT